MPSRTAFIARGVVGKDTGRQVVRIAAERGRPVDMARLSVLAVEGRRRLRAIDATGRPNIDVRLAMGRGEPIAVVGWLWRRNREPLSVRTGLMRDLSSLPRIHWTIIGSLFTIPSYENLGDRGFGIHR